MTFADLTVVTSCVDYGEYLPDWAHSIVTQTLRPGHVCIFTHGTLQDNMAGERALRLLTQAGISGVHVHDVRRLDFGVARNRAVEMSASPWVMHLDADDTLFLDGIAHLYTVAATADVVQAAYIRTDRAQVPIGRERHYRGADGPAILAQPALASGNSMFRRSFWAQSPYRTDLHGAWDTCLWIGFARLGARFRPSAGLVFKYRQHADSLFNSRRSTGGWKQAHTTSMIQRLRRGSSEVTA